MPTRWIRRGHEFLSRDLWRFRTDQLSRMPGLGVRLLRVLVLSLRGFQRNDCYLRASALTFFTLLSVVPLVALGFGVAKGFRLEQHLDRWLHDALQGQEEVYGRIRDFSNKLLENTQGGLIAGIGVILLFWTVVKLLGHIEISFNHIWGIKVGRTLFRRLADHTLILFLAPVLFIVASSFNVLAQDEVDSILTRSALASRWLDGLLHGGLRLLPFMVIWALFSFIYIYMPNTKVRFGAGLLAGIVAGTIYQGIQWVYIKCQVGVASYNAIYGSFAALPLFLAWVQVSWLVVLLGAEIAFSWQNAETFELEPDCLEASARLRALLALQATHLLVKVFLEEKRPPTAQEIARQLEMPIRLVNQVLFELTGAGIIAEIRSGKSEEPAYSLARAPERVTTGYVLEALARRGTNSFPIPESPEFARLSACIDDLARAVQGSPGNLALKDL
jgi:membrane protein